MKTERAGARVGAGVRPRLGFAYSSYALEAPGPDFEPVDFGDGDDSVYTHQAAPATPPAPPGASSRTCRSCSSPLGGRASAAVAAFEEGEEGSLIGAS